MISSQEKKIINNRVGLLNLAEELGNISKACKVMGFSCDTFYRYKEAHDQGGVKALLDTNRKKPNHRNRVEDFVEKAILELAVAEPALGQLRVANELRKQGIAISAGGVRSVWMRHDLEVFPKRLKALEKKSCCRRPCFH